MRREALQFSSIEKDVRHLGGRAGTAAWFVVVNRAQRCEFHKLAVFLVGGGGSVVLCAELMLVAILVKYESARNFERPPSHPAL